MKHDMEHRQCIYEISTINLPQSQLVWIIEILLYTSVTIYDYLQAISSYIMTLTSHIFIYYNSFTSHIFILYYNSFESK